jgi:hypothetical protein
VCAYVYVGVSVCTDTRRVLESCDAAASIEFDEERRERGGPSLKRFLRAKRVRLHD